VAYLSFSCFSGSGLSDVLNREIIWILSIVLNNNKKSSLSDTQNFLDIFSFNLFVQITLDKFFDLTVCKLFV